MDIGYIVGVLILPIVVVMVAIIMRLINRKRPLKPKHYLVIAGVYAVIIGINMLMPIGEKVMIIVLAAIILTAGYWVDKKLSIEQRL